MKILIAIDTYQTNNNGTSISAQRYADMLRQHGHEVRILSVDSSDYRLSERHIYPFDRLIHKHGFRFANSLSSTSEQTIQDAVSWCDLVHCMMPFMLSHRVKQAADHLGKPATAAFHIQPENLTSSAGLGKVGWLSHMIYRLFYHMVYKHFRHVHTPADLWRRSWSSMVTICASTLSPTALTHRSAIGSAKKTRPCVISSSSL